MIRINPDLDRRQFIGAIALVFVVTSLYSAVAYALEFLVGINPALIFGVGCGLAYASVEMFLRLRYSKELYRIAAGRDERSVPQDLFFTMPVPLAVCIRLGNYSIYSAVFVAALIILWFVMILSFSE